MSLKHQVINSLSWNTIAVLVNTLMQVLRIAVLARLLDDSDFGLVAISLAVVAFCEVFSDLGFTVPLLHKQDITKHQYSSVFWVNVFISIVIYLILFLVSPLIANAYSSDELIQICRLLGLTVIVNALGKIFQTRRTKDLQFKFISIVSIISSVLGFLIIFVLAYKGFGVYSLVYGTISQIVFRQGVYFFTGLRTKTISFYINLSEIKDFFKIGGYQLGSQLCDFLVAKADVFILGKMVGMTELGYYNLAKELVLKCYNLLNSITRGVMTSALAKVQTDNIRTSKIFSIFSEILSYSGVLLFLFLFAFSSFVSKAMYGESYIYIEPLLSILCFYGLFSTFISPMAALSMAKGRTNIVLSWTVSTAVISLGITAASASWGLYSLVYAQVAISIIFFFLNWKMIIARLLGMSFLKYVSIYLFAVIGMVIPSLILNIIDIKQFVLLCVVYTCTVGMILFIIYKRGFVSFIRKQ